MCECTCSQPSGGHGVGLLLKGVLLHKGERSPFYSTHNSTLYCIVRSKFPLKCQHQCRDGGADGGKSRQFKGKSTDNTHPILARGTGFGQVQNNKDHIQEYIAGFDAEMAELVEERDVTDSIKENQWSFLTNLQITTGPPHSRGTWYIAYGAGEV